MQMYNYGWVCPLCNRANAPWVTQCLCSQPNQWIWEYHGGTTTTEENSNDGEGE